MRVSPPTSALAVALAAALVAALVAVSCISPRGGVDLGTRGAEFALAWPEQPNRARVRYLTSIATPSDVGARPSLVRRIINAVTGTASPRVRQPYGIAIDTAGRILVADVLAHGVHRFDPVTGSYDFLTVSGRNGLRSPIGVAVDVRGEIHVADSELGQVVVLRDDGRERRRVTTGITRPSGLAYDAKRDWMWVVDTQGHRIVAFGSDGVARDTIGRRGTGAGEFNFPTNAVVGPDGAIYVTDALNVRIQVFEPDGRFRRAFGRHGDAIGDLARPKGIALDSDGHVWVVEGLYDVVNIFTPEGEPLLSVGAAGSGPGEFWLATGIAIDRHDRIYVGDSHNGRVQVLQYMREQP